ncbi:TIGR04255 family protein [Janthinobacterium lividum]|uniref:TIGR04255 family protein n=1 Tax=Janthinobacterium lividum TaxID=29581 RepID=UPI0009B824AE|nr:TIGR04255 family protein [Janthinobacterium lividum]
MQIAPSARVIYTHNPLAEVLSQVRFERILSLETERPVQFQETFAARDYPKLEIEDAGQFFGLAFGGEDRRAHKPFDADVSLIYHFSSVDDNWKLSLSSDFLSLTCTSYEGWPEFRRRFVEALDVLRGIYPHLKPARLGLRYKDIIERTPLGLSSVPWRELLQPFVLGIMASSDFSTDGFIPERALESLTSNTLLRLSDCYVSIQTAYLQSLEGDEHAFLIDSDFYSELSQETLPFDEVSSRFENLHNSAGALFRRCITERLHDALGPT